ncbi:hypothetical protein RYX45_06495 [Alkalihalophilus pseudofirmus]|uniref:Uncharacterized protein n=1 Tax=Alkalihalophilus pseudofirmus TaxID=79885 RepID=A0AAJ2L1A8_ALKPS|nr:hypothetical protein [Alkalihalophilus pseudofirmus]MDV2884820.1 hypothetical protein [Alkalihalophilus pseudofirmus]
MKKTQLSTILYVCSLIPVIANIMIYYVYRGPTIDIYFVILTYGVLAALGIAFASVSWYLKRRHLLFIFSLLGNGFFVVIAALLLLAMGISEP